jgi:hypothetical protein
MFRNNFLELKKLNRRIINALNNIIARKLNLQYKEKKINILKFCFTFLYSGNFYFFTFDLLKIFSFDYHFA